MNIPVPTYAIKIVINGKVKSLNNYTSITPPSEEIVKELAKEEGYENYTDWVSTMIDDGRDC